MKGGCLNVKVKCYTGGLPRGCQVHCRKLANVLITLVLKARQGAPGVLGVFLLCLFGPGFRPRASQTQEENLYDALSSDLYCSDLQLRLCLADVKSW